MDSGRGLPDKPGDPQRPYRKMERLAREAIPREGFSVPASVGVAAGRARTILPLAPRSAPSPG